MVMEKKSAKYISKRLHSLRKLLCTLRKCLQNFLHSPAKPLQKHICLFVLPRRTHLLHSTQKRCVCLQYLHVPLKSFPFACKIFAFHWETLCLLAKSSLSTKNFAFACKFLCSTEKLSVCLQYLRIPLRNFAFAWRSSRSTKHFAFACKSLHSLRNLNHLKTWFTFPQKLCIHSKNVCVSQESLCLLTKHIYIPLRNFVFTWKTLKIHLCPSNKLIFSSICLKIFVFLQETLGSLAKCLCVSTKTFGFIEKTFAFPQETLRSLTK